MSGGVPRTEHPADTALRDLPREELAEDFEL